MESIVVYKFYVRITGNKAQSISLSEDYDFGNLFTSIETELKPISQPGWIQIPPKFGKRYLSSSLGIKGINNPGIHYWTIQANKEENHTVEWTTIRVDNQFYSIPVWQNVPVPADARIFKNYYIGIRGTKVEQVEWWDWHVQWYFFSHEKWKSWLEDEIRRVLKKALFWQRCELKKIILRKRLEQIEDSIESIKFTGTIRSKDTFSVFGEDRGVSLNFTLSATSEAKLKAADYLYGKEATKAFFIGESKPQIVINSNGSMRTVSPENESREDGKIETFVEFDTSWRKMEFFTFADFQAGCIDYIRENTDLAHQ